MVLRNPMETDRFACFPFLKSQHHTKIWIAVSTLVCGCSLLCLKIVIYPVSFCQGKHPSQADGIRFIASHCRLRVILRLGIPEFIIFSISLSNQLIMAAKLNQTSFVKHSNFITDFAGRQTVADKYSSLVTYNAPRRSSSPTVICPADTLSG